VSVHLASRLGALSAAVLSLAAAPTPRPTEAPLTSRIETAVSSEMSRLAIPGLTVAVVADGQLLWSNGYGLADIENFVPAKTSTVYRIASLSKPITATAVMQLAERGKLDLDAPIQKYVPAFPEKQWPVTARHLLGHQSGLRHVQDEEWSSTRHYTTLTSSLDIFKDEPLLFTPGTKTEYSTYGFNLLGCAVEGASGSKFLDYLRENLFGPAGMEHTRADDVYEVIPNRAPGYQRLPSGHIVNSVLADTSNKIPGGGLCATAPDVARFAIAMLGNALVSRESWDTMVAAQKTADGKTTGYGLGWRVGRWRGRREVWHHGGQPRVSTLLYMQPDRRFAVVFLANLENVYQPLTELARQISLQAIK
jgi:serine beta-lactamase-like protein LACTB, mitochondrial